jgi:hypothetical protein
MRGLLGVNLAEPGCPGHVRFAPSSDRIADITETHAAQQSTRIYRHGNEHNDEVSIAMTACGAIRLARFKGGNLQRSDRGLPRQNRREQRGD